MFPELELILKEARAEAKPEAVFCVDYKGHSKNLRSQFKRILLRAGIELWSKLFQNLRSTRETELLRDHDKKISIKSVASFLGNSPGVALKHYAQVTEADHKEALSLAVLKPKPLHNPLQTPAVSSSTELHPETTLLAEHKSTGPKNSNAPNLTAQCMNESFKVVAVQGLEPRTLRI